MSHADNHDAQDASFATLEARVERVADATIRKKWKKLPLSTHSAARDALSVARLQARSRRVKGKSNQIAEDCIDGMLNRLHDRLPRIPYPSATDESHFDHDANLNRASKLESQLADDAHAMKLLQAQIAKEEELRAIEEKELRRLEKNASGEETARRTRNQNLHPQAREMGQDISNIDVLSLTRQDGQRNRGGLESLYEDVDLRPILGQLENHLSSISQNVRDTSAVSRIVEKAQHELVSTAKT